MIRCDFVGGSSHNYANFVSIQTITWRTCRFCHEKQTNVYIQSWFARKHGFKNIIIRNQLSRYLSTRRTSSLVVASQLPQEGDLSKTTDELSPNYRRQLEYETLQSLDWFPICEKVASFCYTDKVRHFVANGMRVNEWSKEQTEQYLKETDECIRLMQSGSSPTDWIMGAHLLEDIVDKAQKGRLLTPKELYEVASTIVSISKWKRSLQGQSTNYPYLHKIVANVVSLRDLEDCISKCIDEKEQVKDEASTHLFETRTQIRSTFDNIKKVLQNLLRQHGEAVQEPIYTERFGRFVIPVKASYKNRVPGIIQDVSSSGLTLYIEPNSIRSLTNRLQQLRHIEEEAVEEILLDLSRKVCENANHLLHISHVVFQLDWILARAQFSVQINGRLPNVVDSFDNSLYGVDGWKLCGVRHPLLEINGENSVVPIDFDIRPGVTAVCITGPNTGGKTVALKTFGVVILMTKVGLFVPCTQNDVTIPFFEDVFADVGDHQSVIQSVSTFSSHVLRIQRILQLSHRHSLVLLDEIGTGTDPVEGCALAMSILLYLVERVGFLMVTTHHGELKALKYKDSRFENASVEFDSHSLKPNYRLVWGVAGRSNAIDIAQRLGLENWIVENARNIVEKAGDKLSLVIEDIERKKEQIVYLKEEMERKEKALELREQQLLEKEEQVRQLEQEWIETKKEALQQDFANAREQIAKVIKQVQQYGTDASFIMEKRQELESLMVQQNDIRSQESISRTKVRKGDWVIVKRLSSEPLQVVEDMNSKGELMVRCGSVRVKVSRMEVSLANNIPTNQKRESKPKQSKKQVSIQSSSSFRKQWNTIDVRGCRVDEATAKIENELGRNAECDQYFIIHGFGPLRTGLRQYFHRHPLVSKMNDADTENGGQGVTILHLHME